MKTALALILVLIANSHIFSQLDTNKYEQSFTDSVIELVVSDNTVKFDNLLDVSLQAYSSEIKTALVEYHQLIINNPNASFNKFWGVSEYFIEYGYRWSNHKNATICTISVSCKKHEDSFVITKLEFIDGSSMQNNYVFSEPSEDELENIPHLRPPPPPPE